jgi:hypothetical protein
VYSLYPVVDAIAHEYEFGGGDHMASSRTPFDWFAYQVGMHSFRAFAEGKATWILNYSWDGDKKVDRRQAMMNLAMSQVMAGANFWDAPGHSMAGSNDLPTRKKIFSWIAAHEKTFYLPRSPMHPIGVYFSPLSRDYDAKDFLRSYRGILILLMQKHLEFQVVTPRTLANFQGKTLILPDVRVLNQSERTWLGEYVAAGNNLVITGADITQLDTASNVLRFQDCPGKAYITRLETDFEHSTPDSQQLFLNSLKPEPNISVVASPQVATSISQVAGKPHVFFTNFAGLRGGVTPVQTPQTGVRITIAGASKNKAYFLPFLGEVQELKAVQADGGMTFTLPEISKGAVFWYEPLAEEKRVGVNP